MTRRHAIILYFALTAPLMNACGSDTTGPDEPDFGPAVAPGTPLLEPGFLTLRIGEEAKLLATIMGPAQTRTDPPSPIHWQVSAPDVATVSPDGVVRGLARGETRIRALADGFMATASVRVR